jgi:pyruvate/2-oxoglutarate dehydrogenase complex dihydrolipoamide dehydrogenase (E3) component
MNYDLIVIGGGSGGLTATSVACRMGAKVLLLEKHALGGDCLFTGCVPSKTLIRSAAVAHLQRTAARYGLPAQAPTIDGAQVMARVKEVIAKVAEHDAIPRFEALGAEVRIGAARFVSRDEVEAGGQRYRARGVIVATGSRPAVPAIDGLREASFLTNESIFDLKEIPASLVVLGGGAVGLELGQAMQRLGAQVTIVEADDRVLPKEDPDCSTEIRARLEAEGVTIHTATQVERVSRADGKKLVHCTQGGSPLTVSADELLVATGRAPNLEGLELGAAGIDADARRIVIDAELRTTNPRVFAVGDVAGNYLFTHSAGYEAALAVRNALLPLAAKVDYRALPFATFTDPEVAHVGLTEPEARKLPDPVTVLKTPMSHVDRALTDGESGGFVKLLVARGKLVGAHIVAAHAGELIHPAVLALKEELKLSAIAGMSWIYPTLSEGVRKASQSSYEQLLGKRPVRAAVGLLMRLKGR